MNVTPKPQDFRSRDPASAPVVANDVRAPADDTLDPRVPREWQGSAGFRAAHFIAATWLLVALTIAVGVYIFAVRHDAAAVVSAPPAR